MAQHFSPIIITICTYNLHPKTSLIHRGGVLDFLVCNLIRSISSSDFSYFLWRSNYHFTITTSCIISIPHLLFGPELVEVKFMRSYVEYSTCVSGCGSRGIIRFEMKVQE